MLMFTCLYFDCSLSHTSAFSLSPSLSRSLTNTVFVRHIVLKHILFELVKCLLRMRSSFWMKVSDPRSAMPMVRDSLLLLQTDRLVCGTTDLRRFQKAYSLGFLLLGVLERVRECALVCVPRTNTDTHAFLHWFLARSFCRVLFYFIWQM
jgi:hypothetical protein